jgi:hypothetical protein
MNTESVTEESKREASDPAALAIALAAFEAARAGDAQTPARLLDKGLPAAGTSGGATSGGAGVAPARLPC